MNVRGTSKALPTGLAVASAITACLLLTGCGASESIGSSFSPSKILSGTLSGPKEMDPAVFAATPVCPTAEVRDGTEAMPIHEGGKSDDPAAVRFQASVQRVARDCEEAGDGVRVRVGVAGRVLSGPKGATGQVTVPIRVAVVVGEKVVYSKLSTQTVTVQAPDYSALFSIVDESIVLSVADSQQANILVGLDGKGDIAAPKKGKARVSK